MKIKTTRVQKTVSKKQQANNITTAGKQSDEQIPQPSKQQPSVKVEQQVEQVIVVQGHKVLINNRGEIPEVVVSVGNSFTGDLQRLACRIARYLQLEGLIRSDSMWRVSFPKVTAIYTGRPCNKSAENI
jgi:hypothetical protein